MSSSPSWDKLMMRQLDVHLKNLTAQGGRFATDNDMKDDDLLWELLATNPSTHVSLLDHLSLPVIGWPLPPCLPPRCPRPSTTVAASYLVRIEIRRLNLDQQALSQSSWSLRKHNGSRSLLPLALHATSFMRDRGEGGSPRVPEVASGGGGSSSMGWRRERICLVCMTEREGGVEEERGRGKRMERRKTTTFLFGTFTILVNTAFAAGRLTRPHKQSVTVARLSPRQNEIERIRQVEESKIPHPRPTFRNLHEKSPKRAGQDPLPAPRPAPRGGQHGNSRIARGPGDVGAPTPAWPGLFTLKKEEEERDHRRAREAAPFWDALAPNPQQLKHDPLTPLPFRPPSLALRILSIPGLFVSVRPRSAAAAVAVQFSST
ncbi:hypothetical protein NL676_014293 [Syzygium grande]|nr:hypothetical protein NL676_014293 [Syzygium grande]